MSVIEKEQQLTVEEILKLPEMSDWHAAIRYAQTTPFSKMFPQKYEMSIKHEVTLIVHTLFEECANLTQKDVVASVLSRLKDDISPELIIKMTQIIIDEWTQLSMKVQKYEPLETFV
jgi:aminoglycoside N3'-acetyltransferase